MTLDHSSIKWFETDFRKPISKGLPSSYIQLQILTDLFVAHLDEAAARRINQNNTVLYAVESLFLNNSKNLAISYNMADDNFP